jgi:predicted ATPase
VTVIGRFFSLTLLEDLESTRPDAALEAIEEAERAQLVSAERTGRDMRYRFVHEQIRQTLVEALSRPRRQRLHARIAIAIERVFSSERQEPGRGDRPQSLRSRRGGQCGKDHHLAVAGCRTGHDRRRS